MIFRPYHGNAQINSKHVGIVPARKRIEGIHVTIQASGFFCICAANIPQNLRAIGIKERR